jgi:hypothetical protein
MLINYFESQARLFGRYDPTTSLIPSRFDAKSTTVGTLMLVYSIPFNGMEFVPVLLYPSQLAMSDDSFMSNWYYPLG